jgi:hypothetical protein
MDLSFFKEHEAQGLKASHGQGEGPRTPPIDNKEVCSDHYILLSYHS